MPSTAQAPQHSIAHIDSGRGAFTALLSSIAQGKAQCLFVYMLLGIWLLAAIEGGEVRTALFGNIAQNNAHAMLRLTGLQGHRVQ